MTGTARVSAKGSRPQRNFLRDYDLMLKVLQQDYVDCARYTASGYAEFIGQLYTLNSTMFQSPVYCDHVLTQMMLHYLAWYQDPNLVLQVSPDAAWHRVDSYRTQRYGDALYVTKADPTAPVKVGDRIVGVNKKPLDAIRPEVERTLHTTVEPPDPGREDWSLVLAFARHLTLRDAGGVERTIAVVPGESAVTDRMKRLYAERGEGPAPVQAPVCSEPLAQEPFCSLAWRDGVAVLRLRDLGATGFGIALRESLAAVASATDMRGLVVDARGAAGGSWDEVYALMPYVLREGAVASPADAFGRPGVLLNCSRRTIGERLAVLDEARAAMVGPDGDLLPGAFAEELATVDALIDEFAACKGKGLQPDESDYYTPALFKGAGAAPTVVLADRYTRDGAEWLAKAAVRLHGEGRGRAVLAGRATMGSIDNTCVRCVRLDEDFALLVPTAKFLCALGDGATLGRGVVPHVSIPWTPEQLERDVELEQACALVREHA